MIGNCSFGVHNIVWEVCIILISTGFLFRAQNVAATSEASEVASRFRLNSDYARGISIIHAKEVAHGSGHEMVQTLSDCI